MPSDRPDILFIMTDQQRFDTIAALGNPHIYTPNLDRLVSRGLTFSRAYSTCPVCVAARYTIRTGCEPPTTRVFANSQPKPVAGQPLEMELLASGNFIPHLGMKTSVTKDSCVARKHTMQGRGKATAMRPGSPSSIRNSTFLSSPWENGLR